LIMYYREKKTIINKLNRNRKNEMSYLILNRDSNGLGKREKIETLISQKKDKRAAMLAKLYYIKYLTKHDDHRYDYYVLLCFINQKYDKIIQLCEEKKIYRVQKPICRKYLALSYIFRNRINDALNILDQSINTMKASPINNENDKYRISYLYFSKSQILFRLGKTREALKELENIFEPFDKCSKVASYKILLNIENCRNEIISYLERLKIVNEFQFEEKKREFLESCIINSISQVSLLKDNKDDNPIKFFAQTIFKLYNAIFLNILNQDMLNELLFDLQLLVRKYDHSESKMYLGLLFAIGTNNYTKTRRIFGDLLTTHNMPTALKQNVYNSLINLCKIEGKYMTNYNEIFLLKMKSIPENMLHNSCNECNYPMYLEQAMFKYLSEKTDKLISY